ncbi:two-component system activity regulator YycH [Paenibacillus sp. HB172176]|uniref:YycH family regulatory protein n=1 Tax=Paenibacillus sp. HB172176 TaxID=2493690 RepID=UPI00143B212E|nr:two-component system activity regulator YycH [Paenibacillus sp. HB172176]
MVEKAKTVILIVLVALSLLQSYLLANSMPGIGATVRSDQDYVNAEPLGPTSKVEDTIFPDQLIIHMGDNKHTIIYPGSQFYEMILNQRIAGREFKGFQRSPISLVDWNEVRKNDIGIELQFEQGISVDLLQKLLKLEGDLLFLNERIDRIWIFKKTDSEEIRTFFFSNDGKTVYESVRADLTVRDVQDYVGFGEHLPAYRMMASGIYLPEEPLKATEIEYTYESYSPEQMQRNLFFDPNTTRAIEDRSGSQIYTDGKRGLQVEQNGLWISYTNPAATQSNDTPPSENVYSAVDFINDHGGWDGTYRLMSSTPDQDKKYVTFRRYINNFPVMDSYLFHYGYMKLTVLQGTVTEYSRSLITLDDQAASRTTRYLYGGDELENRLDQYLRSDEVVSVFPAMKAMPKDNQTLLFSPVWAVRLKDGSESVLLDAYPAGFEPQVQQTDADGDEEEGRGEETDSEKTAAK